MKVYTKDAEGALAPLEIEVDTVNELIDHLQEYYSTQSTTFEGYTLTETAGGYFELAIRYVSYVSRSYISHVVEYFINTEAEK